MCPDKNDEKGNNDGKNSRVEALAGVLDFHSDRTEAHASFLVACVFGLFTLLAIAQDLENTWLTLFSIVPYGVIVLVAFHCLERFTYFAGIAEKLKVVLDIYAKPEKILIDKKGNIISLTGEKIPIETKGNIISLKEYRSLYDTYSGIPKKFRKNVIFYIAGFCLFFIPSIVVYVPILGLWSLAILLIPFVVVFWFAYISRSKFGRAIKKAVHATVLTTAEESA